VFFAGCREYMTLVGYKGLPQGSVLSPFLYNIIGSCTDRFVPAGCGFLQYADDLVVYVTHREPTSVFTAELAPIRMVMHHIENEALELDKGNGITENLATYPSVRVRV
jgi:hypothetical protein